MKPTFPKYQYHIRTSTTLVVGLILALTTTIILTNNVFAAVIPVNQDCSIVSAIKSANTDTSIGGCTAGKGADTIVLKEQTYRLNSVRGTDSHYGDTGLPYITSNITVAGNGATIERNLAFTCPGDGDPEFRHFFVESTGKLTLADLTLRNGCSLYGGSAVHNAGGTLTIRSCNIEENNSQAAHGAVMNSSNGTITITEGSEIRHNEGTGVGNSADTSMAILDHSRIWDNYSFNDGGGIKNDEHLLIETSYIYSNTAKGRGGGISVVSSYGDGAVISITHGSRIWGNVAERSGGGIRAEAFRYKPSARISISDSHIYDNRAVFEEGGGLLVEWIPLTITGGSIYGNSSDEDGGGIHFVSNSFGAFGMDDVSVYANASGGDGGGIYMDNGDFAVHDSRIYDNQSQGRGGGLFIADADFAMMNSMIGGNTAGENGGGLYRWDDAGGSIAIDNSSILYNSAKDNGGGLFSNVDASALGLARYIASSCIVGNSDSSVYVPAGGGQLTAKNNWWGESDGPGGDGPGEGDSVNGDVKFTPFKTKPIPVCPVYPPVTPTYLPFISGE